MLNLKEAREYFGISRGKILIAAGIPKKFRKTMMRARNLKTSDELPAETNEKIALMADILKTTKECWNNNPKHSRTWFNEPLWIFNWQKAIDWMLSGDLKKMEWVLSRLGAIIYGGVA